MNVYKFMSAFEPFHLAVDLLEEGRLGGRRELRLQHTKIENKIKSMAQYLSSTIITTFHFGASGHAFHDGLEWKHHGDVRTSISLTDRRRMKPAKSG